MLPFAIPDLDWWLWLLNVGVLAVFAAMTYAAFLNQKIKPEDEGGSLVLELILGGLSFIAFAGSLFSAILGIIGLFTPR